MLKGLNEMKEEQQELIDRQYNEINRLLSEIKKAKEEVINEYIKHMDVDSKREQYLLEKLKGEMK